MPLVEPPVGPLMHSGAEKIKPRLTTVLIMNFFRYGTIVEISVYQNIEYRIWNIDISHSRRTERRGPILESISHRTVTSIDLRNDIARECRTTSTELTLIADLVTLTFDLDKVFAKYVFVFIHFIWTAIIMQPSHNGTSDAVNYCIENKKIESARKEKLSFTYIY